jgi:hypothetical protein
VSDTTSPTLTAPGVGDARAAWPEQADKTSATTDIAATTEHGRAAISRGVI